MLNMLKADFYRLLRGKAIYFAIVLMLFMLGLSIYGVSAGSVGMNATLGVSDEMDDLPYEQTRSLSMSEYRKLALLAEGHPLDLDILTANMNLYYVFLFVAVIVLTADFSSGCVKNTLSSAIDRNKYFLSKLVMVNLCCTALFFLNTYAAHFGTILFNSGKFASDIGTVTKVSLVQLPAILALVSILTGIGFLVKRTAVFNTVTIPFIIVFQLALQLCVTYFPIKKSFLQYELESMIHRLAGDPTTGYLLRSYLVCAGIIIAFNLLGYLSFRKAEIG